MAKAVKKAAARKSAEDDTARRHEKALELVAKAIQLVGAKNVKSFVDELESEKAAWSRAPRPRVGKTGIGGARRISE